MPKTRMTNADREAIRDAVLAHKFTPIEAARRTEENALAKQVRARVYGDFLSVMEAAPEGAFRTSSDLRVNVGGKHFRLRFGGAGERVRIWHTHEYDPALAVPDTDKLGARIAAWADASEAARSERSDLRYKVGATLGSFRHFEDAQSGWPEADRFITEQWRKRCHFVPGLPAVAISDLTAALDLPPEIEAEAA